VGIALKTIACADNANSVERMTRMKKKRKVIRVWALIPYDMEMKTMYFSTEKEANLNKQWLLEACNGMQSDVVEMEQFADTVQRKAMSIARDGIYI